MTGSAEGYFLIIEGYPMTCPDCGSRTEWDDKVDETGFAYQEHTCLGCGKQFLACEDD